MARGAKGGASGVSGVVWKRKGSGQQRLSVEEPKKRSPDVVGFDKRRKALRELYKKYRAGLVKEESLTPHQRELLMKYYGL